jgi:hypothetical protein
VRTHLLRPWFLINLLLNWRPASICIPLTMRSSLLGSWIDVEAAAAAAETLCVPPPVVAAAGEVSALVEPVRGEANESFVSVPAPVRPFASQSMNDTPAMEATNETPIMEASNETPIMEASNETPPPLLHGRLSALRARAERNGLVSVVPVVVGGERPVFVVPLGSLPVRVRALADWINEVFLPESLFVADDQGQSLVEFGGGAQLLAAASVLAEAAAKARRHLPGEAGASMVQLALGGGQVLSLVSVATVMGRWHVGLTTVSPLTEADALAMADHLQATAAGG